LHIFYLIAAAAAAADMRCKRNDFLREQIRFIEKEETIFSLTKGTIK
jgi:5'(3')-deoxyribonucleotidase